MNNKTIVGIGVGIGVVIIAILIFTIASDSGQNGIEPKIITKNEKLGLVINTPTSAVTIQQLAQTYEDASLTGIGRSNVYMFWDITEPEKGQYNFKETDILMSLNRKHDLTVTLYFSIINGKTLGPFPDWIGKPSLNAISEDNLVKVLDVILSRYDIIDSVIIAGETDEHFRYQEESIPVYDELFNNVYDRIKEKHPDVKIGNAFSLHGVFNKNLEHIVEQLTLGDFVAFTYFPVDSLNDINKTPKEAKDDLEKALELVPNKKVAIFEISWSTSDFVGGNPNQQVEFLNEIYDLYDENESKFEFFTWYRQYDRQAGICAIDPQSVEGTVEVGGSSELGSSAFVMERLSNYICSTGLINADGEPKPGWNEFKKQIQRVSS